MFASRSAPGAGSRAGLTLSAGRLTLDGNSALLDAAGHGTAGGFTKLVASAGHEQALDARHSLGLSVQGQWSDGNLDGAEKLSLGGPEAVRAYSASQGSSDHAVVLRAEARRLLAPDWQATLFADGGWGRRWHSALPGDGNNSRHLAGLGLALEGRLAAATVKAQLAWRTTGAATSEPDRRPRLLVNANVAF
jgi:hemolysin activation/secretion protein